MRCVDRVWACGLACALVTGPATAQVCSTETDEIIPATGAEGDRFGQGVAADGEVIVVGVPHDDTTITDAGAARVYRRTGDAWIDEDFLLASDGAALDLFGWSVAIDGDVIVVGAPQAAGAAPVSGAAYVFRHDGGEWNEEAILVPSIAGAADRFARAVSISGDVIALGGSRSDVAGDNAGAVAVFRFDDGSWQEEAIITAADAAPGDQLGYGVAIAGDMILAGAHVADAVYAFTRIADQWIQTQKIAPASVEPGDRFGESVGLDGDRAVVGAPLAEGTGAAWVFERIAGVWDDGTRFTPVDENDAALYGHAVAVRGDRVVIGARFATVADDSEDGTLDNAGYIQSLQDAGNLWVDTGRLGFAEPGGELGTSVTIAADFIASGAPQRRPEDVRTGAVAIFEHPVFVDCNENGVIDGCDMLDGTDPDCNGNGVPDACDLASGVEPDCNENGLSDACDIVLFRSLDCNANQVPDDCDIDAGAADCNDNRVIDACAAAPQQSELRAAVPRAGDFFGDAAAADADQMVITATEYFSVPPGTSAGRAVVYQRIDGHWAVDQVIPSTLEPGPFVHFGDVVDISGDQLAVSGGQNTSVETFTRGENGWSFVQSLPAPPGADSGGYGRGLALDGGVLAVAGILHFNVVVYRRTRGEWAFETTLERSNPMGSAGFGNALDVHDDLIVVAEPSYFVTQNSRGRVLVYRDDGGAWSEEASIPAPDVPGQVVQGFGAQVATDGTHIVMTTDFSPTERVFVYRREGVEWNLVADLVPDPPVNTTPGLDLAFPLIIAGQPPLVFAFDGAAWSELTRPLPNVVQSGDQYGRGSALAGRTALVTARYRDVDDSFRAGAVFEFDLGDVLDCNANGVPDDCDIADGTSDDTNGNTLPDECEGLAAAPGDVNGDGVCDVNDLVLVITAWGPCPELPAACPEDVNGDGEVDVDDLVAVIVNWTA